MRFLWLVVGILTAGKSSQAIPTWTRDEYLGLVALDGSWAADRAIGSITASDEFLFSLEIACRSGGRQQGLFNVHGIFIPVLENLIPLHKKELLDRLRGSGWFLPLQRAGQRTPNKFADLYHGWSGIVDRDKVIYRFSRIADQPSAHWSRSSPGER